MDLINSENELEHASEMLEYNFRDAANNLILACSALEKLHTVKESYTELSNYYNDITSHAMIYCKKIFPFSKTAIQYIQEFFEEFEDYESPEEFKTEIDYHLTKTNERHAMAFFTLQLNQAILLDFRKIETDFNSQSNTDTPNTKEDEKNNTSLYTPLNGFISALTPLVKFLAVADNELAMLAKNIDPKEIRIKKYFNTCKKKSKFMIVNCRKYIGEMKICDVTISTFSDENDNFNVGKWIHEKKIKVYDMPENLFEKYYGSTLAENTISLIDLAKKFFVGKKFQLKLRLLEDES